MSNRLEGLWKVARRAAIPVGALTVAACSTGSPTGSGTSGQAEASHVYTLECTNGNIDQTKPLDFVDGRAIFTKFLGKQGTYIIAITTPYTLDKKQYNFAVATVPGGEQDFDAIISQLPAKTINEEAGTDQVFHPDAAVLAELATEVRTEAISDAGTDAPAVAAAKKAPSILNTSWSINVDIPGQTVSITGPCGIDNPN